jgi:hypothetical protein
MIRVMKGADKDLRRVLCTRWQTLRTLMSDCSDGQPWMIHCMVWDRTGTGVWDSV